MKLALISDVHGNQEALEAVLRDTEKQGAESLHFLGDAVGYGCNPNECVRLIKKHCDIKLLGNHDYAAMGLEATDNFNQAARQSMSWTQEELSQKTIQTLSNFEMSAVYLDYFLVHASPGQPEEWNYILDMESALGEFDNFSQGICFVGHSHLPTCYKRDDKGGLIQDTGGEIIFLQNCKYIINIGSVGQPRDNNPRACYVLIDTESKKLTYRRVDYDIKKTQDKMMKARLPEFLIKRIAIGV